MKPETQLQAAIVGALNKAGWVVWRIACGQTRVARGRLHGAPKGAPDLYVLGWGWLEVKRDTGRTSQEQAAIHALLRTHGERVAVVRSAAEALEAVRG